ncbi:MAG TPA: hypothetical protein H9899_11220 [Candidatus Sphingomonas excrementigallinarum]|nr:hypothetical protein [Candidatus Sphingomonas excrementigallinarum]
MRAILVILAALIAHPVSAQVVMDARPSATKADVDVMRQQAQAAADAAAQAVKPADLSAAIGALQASIPRARTTAPMQEAVGGAAGTAGTYLPGDAQAPRITRAGVVLTSTSTGSWSIAWATPLTATPVTLPIPINATSTPVVCNVATSTATGASGRCWYSRTLPATLTAVTALVSYDVFGAPANGISVQVLAIPVTQ